MLVAAIPGEPAYHPLGTGVFVAPHLVLTAKHIVDKAYAKFDQHSRGSLDSIAPFQINAYSWPGANEAEAIWSIAGLWSTPYSDLALLSAKPANETARQHNPAKIAEINVAPPQLGDLVMAVGYPNTTAKATDTNDGLALTVCPSSTVGAVMAVHESHRVDTILNFPCFEVRAQVFMEWAVAQSTTSRASYVESFAPVARRTRASLERRYTLC